jgi:hypothetical protein
MGATGEYADPYFALWEFAWNLQTISTHPGWLLNGRIFNAPIFYPSTGTLAYSDHEILQSIAVWPIYAATGDVTLCYNLLFLASLVLSALAMYGFVRAITRSIPAAYVAGLVWGFCPFRITHLPHIQLQSLYWMPLSFWLLHRLMAGRRRRDAVLLGIVVALQAVSCVYYGMIGVFGLAAAGLVMFFEARAGRPLFWRRLALAALVSVLVAAPGLWPYWSVQRREGFGRTVFEAEHNSATIASYLQSPPANWIYGSSGWMRPTVDAQGKPLRDEPEKDLFPGFAVIALAIAGLIRGQADRRMLVVAMAAVALTGFVLSLGPNGIRPLYSALHSWVFGFQAIRAPARFAVLVYFALAVLAALAIESSVQRSRSTFRELFVALAALVLIAEFSTTAIAFAPAPALSSSVGRWLEEATESGPVLYLPIGRDRDDALAMLAAIEHGRPILNGFSGQRPGLYPAVVDQVSAFPEPPALLTLRDLGVRFVVLRHKLSALPPVTPIVERASFPEGTIYELRWTPEVDAWLDDLERVVPPPPGPIPFANGETTRYTVRWVGGPMTVPAGEASISAERTNLQGFRFTVHATTASWVERFFQADDTLTTEADAQLLPLEYREELNEGSRRTRRRVVFEPNARRVLVTNGETPPVALPLRREARDPLSALFYVRTLPLAEGFSEALPVNDAGRNTVVAVRVVGSESIEIEGRPVDTWKIEPTFVSRLAWREPPRATVWVSKDARQLPLRIRVTAAFGTIEVETAGSDR